MPSIRCAALLFALLITAVRSESAGWNPDVSFDVMNVGNSPARARKKGESLCGSLTGAGTACASNSAQYAETYGVLGFRAGWIYHGDRWELGPSLGFLSAGPDTGRVTLQTSPAGGALELKTTQQTYRFLLEGGARFHLRGDWQWGLGAGAGWALSHANIACIEHIEQGSYFAGRCTDIEYLSNLGWLNWELTPKVLNGDWEFGVRTTGFTRAGARPWLTWGATLGWHIDWPALRKALD